MKRWKMMLAGLLVYIAAAMAIIHECHLMLGSAPTPAASESVFNPAIGKHDMHIDLCAWGVVLNDDKFNVDTMWTGAEYMYHAYPKVHSRDEWARAICWSARTQRKGGTYG